MLFLDFLFFALLAVGNFPSAVGIQVCPTADAASFWADTGKDDGASMVQMKSGIPEIDFGDPLTIESVAIPKQKDIGDETFVLVGAGLRTKFKYRATRPVYVLGFYVEEKALFKHIQDMKGEKPPAGLWNL